MNAQNSEIYRLIPAWKKENKLRKVHKIAIQSDGMCIACCVFPAMPAPFATAHGLLSWCPRARCTAGIACCKKMSLRRGARCTWRAAAATAPAAVLALALLHTHGAEGVAAGDEHLGRVGRRHEAVAHGAGVRLQLLRKTRLQHGARLQLLPHVLLLLPHHLILQLVLQPLRHLLSYAVHVAATAHSETARAACCSASARAGGGTSGWQRRAWAGWSIWHPRETRAGDRAQLGEQPWRRRRRTRGGALLLPAAAAVSGADPAARPSCCWSSCGGGVRGGRRLLRGCGGEGGTCRAAF
jgi:hypothetical protein